MSDCQDCSYYAGSEHLICAVHPAGPQLHPCPDFQQLDLPEDPDWPWPISEAEL